MYEYIFFDLDGTLTDSKEGIFNCLKYAFKKLGKPCPSDQTLLKFIGPPLLDSFMRYCQFDEATAQLGCRLFRERYVSVGKFENAPAPGMTQLCERLSRNGFTLTVSSSKPENQCVAICERFGFAPYMKTITGSAPDADWNKADVIRETMRRLGLTHADRKRILMVGDRKYDVLGAKELGLDCVGVNFFGYAEPGELSEAGALAVVSTAEELEQFVLRHSHISCPAGMD